MSRSLLALCVVALTTAAAGCGPTRPERGYSAAASDRAPATGEPLRLTYWRHNNQREVAAMRQLIARFEAAHPEVRIDLLTFPYAVYTTKLAASLSTGQGPHLVNIHNSWAYGYVTGGRLQPVPAEVASAAELEAEFFPLLASFAHGGRYWGLPIGASNLGLFYNRELLRGAGLPADPKLETWGDLLAVARRLTQRDASGRMVLSGAALGLPTPQGWNLFLDALLPQHGVPVLSDDLRRVEWNSPAGARVLAWYVGLAGESGVFSHLLPEDVDSFRLGLAAMMVGGSWNLGRLATIAPDLDVGTAPLPHVAGGPAVTYGTGWGNAVTRHTDAARAAWSWRFIAFLSRYDTMVFWADETGELPMRRQVLADEAFLARHAKLRPFIEQLPSSGSSIKKNEARYKAAIVEAMERMIYAGETAEDALARAAAQVDVMLAEEGVR